MEGQEYLWLFTKSLHNEEPKFDSCHANINQAFNNLHETGPEWQVNCGKDDFAHHFGGGDCSDELIQSEHSSTYEQYRPSSLIDNHYVNEHEPISEPSCSNAAPDIDWTNRNFNAGHNQTYQSVEMMITFRTCDSCNIAIKSLNAALNHIVSVNHMTNTNFCVVCLTNLGDKLAYEHRKEEEHVQKAKIYCLLCSVEVRDQYGMKLHQNGSKHRKTIKKFDEILKCNTKYNESLQIRAKGSPTDIIKSGCCESCPNWIMESSVQQVVAHLANENHLINSKCCIICNEKFLSASSARLHMTLDQHKKKAKLTCLVCNVKGPENNMWDHMTGAKHRQKILTLNKLLEDREVVKTDSKTLTWFPDLTNFPLELKKLILIDACRLCKVKLPVQFDVTNHYQGERHKKNVATWLINYEELKKHDAITPPPLSSTPGAMLYNLLNNFPELVSENVNSPNSKLQVAQPHNTNDTSLANSLQVSGEVPESSQKLQTAFSHQDNLQKTSTEVQGVVYCNPVQGSGSESSGGSDIDIKQSENELYKSKLEDKVLSEIKKLVNSLYYSKKVPLDKALEYLKRFNKEIKECVHKVRFAHSNTNLPEVNLNRSSTEKTCFLSSFAVNETDICIEPGQDKIESEQKSAQNNLRVPKKNDFLENGVQIFDKFDSEVEKFLLDTQNNKHFQASPNESSFENKQCFAKNETDISITQRQDKTEFGQLGSKLDSKLEYQVFPKHKKQKSAHIDKNPSQNTLRKPEKNKCLENYAQMFCKFESEFDKSKSETDNPTSPKDNKDLQASNSLRETEKNCVLPSFVENGTDTDSKLKELVFSETKKLVNYLYFSKKVPLDKALEYLKRFNKEIEDFKDNVQRECSPAQHSNLGSTLQAEDISSKSITTQNSDIENCRNSDLTLQADEHDVSKESWTTGHDVTINDEMKSMKQLVTYRNDDLIEDFINKKVSIAQLADENNFLEIEVLTELTKLVDSVYNSREMPLVQTLFYLESFNKEVKEFTEERSSSDRWATFYNLEL